MTPRRAALTLVEAVVVLAILGLLIAMMLPMVRSARPAAERTACLNSMKQIALALHHYHDEHGAMPPAYTVDAEGAPLHSWRTLLLPYLEEQALYDSIDLNKPWDDPDNAAALATSVHAFRCPSADLEPNQTTYLAIVGPEAAMTGGEPVTFDAITDGTATTIWVVDAPLESAVPWMQPDDLSPEEVLEWNEETSFQHPGVFLAAFLDGHAAALQGDILDEAIRAMITASAGDSLEME